MATRTLVVPIIGFHTTDMLEPMVFQAMPLSMKIGDLRKMILDKAKHIKSNKLGLFLRGHHTESGVADKLTDDMTVWQLVATVQKSHKKDIEELESDAKTLRDDQQLAEKKQKQIKDELDSVETELQQLQKAYFQKEKKFKMLWKADDGSKEHKLKLQDLKADRRIDQDRTSELEAKHGVLNRKAASAGDRLKRILQQIEKNKEQIAEAKADSDRFDNSDELVVAGIKHDESASNAKQQVQMLDQMVAMMRKRRSDATNRIAQINDDLDKLNNIISELERKKANIGADRKTKIDEKSRLENNMATSIKKFDELISMSTNTMRKSNNTKSRIDKTLAKTRLLLGRGYSTESHRKDAKKNTKARGGRC